MRARGEKLQCGAMFLVSWSDAVSGGQSPEGKSRLGYVIGLMSSTLKGPRHILQWTSKLTRKLATRSPGGEVYSCSEIADHISPLREFYEPFAVMSPGMIGLEDFESLFTH